MGGFWKLPAKIGFRHWEPKDWRILFLGRECQGHDSRQSQAVRDTGAQVQALHEFYFETQSSPDSRLWREPGRDLKGGGWVPTLKSATFMPHF